MSKRIIIAIIAILALQAHALDVNNTAGTLADRVSDLNVTSLTVTGTMNAEDFYFIADQLHKLTTVDLTNVNVVSCRTADRLQITAHIDINEFNGRKSVQLMIVDISENKQE